MYLVINSISILLLFYFYKLIIPHRKSSDGDQKLGDFFPLFYWILRDFSLDLRGMSAREYLEKCLSSVPGNSPEIQKKNEIREKFKQYFKIRIL